FFFFQAEDGIRDGHVTGVQTCALPIYQRSRYRTDRWLEWPAGSLRLPHQADKDVFQRRLFGIEIADADAGVAEIAQKTGDAGARSEERRVGKEWRARW